MSFVLHELNNTTDQRFSPFAWRARLALKHKGIDFTTKGYGFTSIKTIADGQFKTVPVLERAKGDFLADSHAIGMWLDKTYGNSPLVPGGLKQADSVRFMHHWWAGQVYGAVVKLIIVRVAESLEPVDKAYFSESRSQRVGMPIEDFCDASEEQAERVIALLKPVEALLAEQDFCGGNEVDFNDYILLSNFIWLLHFTDYPIIKPGTALAGWWQRCLGLYDNYVGDYMASIGK